jgi:hypothetical protein
MEDVCHNAKYRNLTCFQIVNWRRYVRWPKGHTKGPKKWMNEKRKEGRYLQVKSNTNERLKDPKESENIYVFQFSVNWPFGHELVNWFKWHSSDVMIFFPFLNFGWKI